MYHYTPGIVGHLSVIIAFVAALVSAYAYFTATNSTQKAEQRQWQKMGRYAFYAQGLAVISVVAWLYTIILGHYFEYNYAWSNSSRSLPLSYLISTFWQNQEGSFLLWIFWNVVLGAILLRFNRSWEMPVMAIFALVQAFLLSMILGVVIPGINLKIGSTPFLLLKEAMPELPVWKADPNFIPKDGNGLNPLLQNYWMVIHPPTLFLGFASTLIPFSFAMAGLWWKKFDSWMRPALPWTLFSIMILGVGILMGGYWAYETLNFGGYWNWDPVENSSFVPWVVLVAAIHTILIAKKNVTALRTAFILSLLGFLLILYSTFLTRSGILGNASVHSFTDLGLSGQLLIYLLTFLAVAIGLIAFRWRQLPKDNEEVSSYSREFWIFIGATVLCLSGFQIIATTSIPVYNAIGEWLGFDLNLALPTDQIAHFNKFQLWFYVLIILLTGVGQYFWWKKLGKNTFKALYGPFVLALIISSAGIYFSEMKSLPYIALFTASIFAIVANGNILLAVARGNYKLSGGAVAHVGAALMLLGILFSSGYSRVISINNSGLLISRAKEFTDSDNKENKENVTLWFNEPLTMGQLMLTWRDVRIEARGIKEYIPLSWVELIERDFHAVAKRDIKLGDKLYFKSGDTLEVYPENFFYEIEYREPSGKIFTLYPRVQINPQMGVVFSPDLKREPEKDLYTYVSMTQDPTAETQWSATSDFTVAMRDTFFVNDYVAVLDNIVRTDDVEGVELREGDAAVRAIIRVFDKQKEYVLTPSFVIKGNTIGRKAEVNKELGIRIQFKEIDPKTGQFTFSVNTSQRDYIVMKAIEKPLINVLWVGTFVMVLGIGLATARRFREFAKFQSKESEAGKKIVKAG